MQISENRYDNIIYNRCGKSGLKLPIVSFGLWHNFGENCDYNNMKELVYYTMLYDIYGSLLTDKQKDYFEEYYFKNLSLGELATKYNVSRNAVHKQLKETIKRLENYEDNLKLAKKNKMLEEIIKKVSDKELKRKLQEVIFI